MENSYGVGVLNRYALFLEDDADPYDAIKRKEREREIRRKQQRDPEKENKAKPEPKQPRANNNNAQQPPAPVAAAAKPSPPQQQQQQQRPPKDGQPPKDRPRSDQQPRGPRPDGARPPGPPRERPPQNRDGRDVRDGPRRDFGDRDRRPQQDGQRDERRPQPPRPRGGARAGGQEGRPLKREFDRRSGSDRTGVKPVDKRDGGGPHNWGSHKDDLDEFNKTQDGEKIDDRPEAAPATDEAPQENKEGEEEPAAGEPEPKELTLDEWKAQRGARAKPQYNLRKAGEGEDLTRWKDMVVLSKPKPADAVEGEGTDDEYDNAEYPQRVGRQKKVIGIEFTFYEQRRGGGGPPGGRGGRGGGRGRGGGGGPRPRREDRPPQHDREARQNAPKVDDSRDFPSLG